MLSIFSENITNSATCALCKTKNQFLLLVHSFKNYIKIKFIGKNCFRVVKVALKFENCPILNDYPKKW